MYEVDLQTKLPDDQRDVAWQKILDMLLKNMNAIPKEQRLQRNDEQVDAWCRKLAKELGLTYYRNDDWLCFCDKELAPS